MSAGHTHMDVLPELWGEPGPFSSERVRDYARSCIATRDAEIARLRAHQKAMLHDPDVCNGNISEGSGADVPACIGTRVDLERLRAERDSLRHAVADLLGGWRYIRQAHGDLYGVGWDRAQDKAEAALGIGPGEMLPEDCLKWSAAKVTW